MTIIGAGGGGGGKGGGGGSARTPSTAPDSLDSRQYANIVEIISEGEIEGLVDDGSSANAVLKSVFFNDTPLLSESGNFNFKDVQLSVKYGTQNQTYIPGAIGTESTTAVNITVRKGVPSIVTITNDEIDAAKVTISIPALQQINASNGDTTGSTVDLEIAVSYAGGAYTTLINSTNGGRITGRTGDEYRIDYLLDLARPNPTDNVDIRVTRITDDSTSQLLSNDMVFLSYTEIVYAKLSYPNTAVIGLRVDAEQFSSIPSRKYLVKGVKVRIPAGASVDQDTGRIIYPPNFVWNGTFSAATWTTCPAWILWDLLTSTRYGLGDHILTPAEKAAFTGNASRLDKWAFFAASKYANQLVDSGLGDGTQEARFACNCILQTAEEAYKLINDLLSVVRCQGFWSQGGLTIAQDAPADATHLFTLANVADGGFSYSGSSLKIRPNVVVVSYLDLDLQDLTYEVVEDVEAIDKYGVVRTEIAAFACTSRGQANRIGKWLLYSERYEKEVVAFGISVDSGVAVRPGQLIKIADPVKAGTRRAGRIAAATTTAITVDDTAATDLSAPGGSFLSVVLPDGTIEKREVASVADAVITVQQPYSAQPSSNSIWVLESQTLEASTWRVLSVEEQDGINYAVTALSHNPSKYAFIEDGEPLQFPDTTNLNDIPAAPQDLTINTFNGAEQQYILNGRVAVRITFSWRPVPGIKFYQVKYRHEDDNFTTVRVQGPTFNIDDVLPGTYEIQVSSISPSGILFSEPALAFYTVKGLNALPSDVTGLSITAISETQAILTWNQSAELDVRIGGKVVIRHDPRIASQAEWGSSNSVVDAVAGSSTQKQVPLIPGTYMVKFEDYLGNRSALPASTFVALPSYQSRLQLDLYVDEGYSDNYYNTGVRWRDDLQTAPFDGTKLNVTYSGSETALLLTPDLYVAADYYEPNYAEGDLQGEYTFVETLDMGHVYDVYFYRNLLTRIIAAGTNFDSAAGLFDSAPGLFDGVTQDVGNVVVYIRSTDSDPAGTPTWSDWKELVHSTLRGRAFQCKAVLTLTSDQVELAVEELGVVPYLLRRVETSNAPSTTSSVTYPASFYDINAVTITPLDLGINESYRLSSMTQTGFTVQFTSAGGPILKQYGFTATGYGRRI